MTLEDKVQTLYYRVTTSGATPIRGFVINESQWVLYINGVEVVTFLATPRNLHYLALGFLASENLIDDISEIASIRVNESSNQVYWYIPSLGVNEIRTMAICEEGVGSIQIRLTHSDLHLPSHRIITSGCGGGVTFDDLSNKHSPIESNRTVRVAQIFTMMHELNERAVLYRECRGVHTSALGDGDRLLSIAEDVGRHNTLDKIRGECMMLRIPTREGILVSTGRISSEMVSKAAKMHVPIIISRTSPTHLAVQLARAWNMALIGYARGGEMQVYNGIERIFVGNGMDGILQSRID